MKSLLCGALIAGALAVPASAGAAFAPGSPGLGDPFFPLGATVGTTSATTR